MIKTCEGMRHKQNCTDHIYQLNNVCEAITTAQSLKRRGNESCEKWK